jgi:type VI secretion system secreted protein VgrG
VGDEVIVAYLDGDPDEPVIVGRVHNAKNILPVTLPAEKTVSLWRTKSSPGGKGFNEIRMDDEAGEELFSIHAQRDYRGVVERDSEITIGRNEKVKVLGEHRTDIVGRNDVVCGSPSSFTGPEYYSTTNFTSLAASDQLMITTGKFDTFVQGSYKITANDEHHYISDVWQMAGPRFEVAASTQVHLSVGGAGGASISITAGEIRLTVGGSSIVLNHGSITAISALIDLNP